MFLWDVSLLWRSSLNNKQQTWCRIDHSFIWLFICPMKRFHRVQCYFTQWSTLCVAESKVSYEIQFTCKTVHTEIRNSTAHVPQLKRVQTEIHSNGHTAGQAAYLHPSDMFITLYYDTVLHCIRIMTMYYWLTYKDGIMDIHFPSGWISIASHQAAGVRTLHKRERK